MINIIVPTVCIIKFPETSCFTNPKEHLFQSVAPRIHLASPFIMFDNALKSQPETYRDARQQIKIDHVNMFFNEYVTNHIFASEELISMRKNA